MTFVTDSKIKDFKNMRISQLIIIILLGYNTFGNELKEDTSINFNIGPVVEVKENNNSDKMYALRPIYSFEKEGKKSDLNILWPFFVKHNSPHSNFWRFLLFYSKYENEKFSTGGFFPIAYWGYNKQNNFYGGLFPIYGSLDDIAGFNHIDFCLFPLYLNLEQDKGNEVSYLWPFVLIGKGDKYNKLRIFPFYSYNHKHNEYYIQSYMWPFFIKADILKKNHSATSWMAWPFIGHNKYNNIDEWCSIWPFFKYSYNNNDGMGFDAPWPFITYRNNVEKDVFQFSIFPLYGQTDKPNKYTSFFLWPLGSYSNEFNTQNRIKRTYFLPLYWASKKMNMDGKVLKNKYRIWPLYSLSEEEKKCEVRIPDLWFGTYAKVIDRNLSPLWTLFKYNSNDTNKSFNYNFLWGGYTYGIDKKNQTEQCNFFPLYSSQKYINKKDNTPTNEKGVLFDIFKYSTSRKKNKITLFWFLEF